MKRILVVFSVLACVIAIPACRKSRTCSCKYTESTTTVTTPRSAGSSSTTTNSSSGTQEVTYSEVKKNEMKRLYGCIGRTETTSNSYTTVVSTPTVLSVGSFTYNSFVSTPADAIVTYKEDYTCEIK